MLIIKALHIISMVAWFAGLFYLPRLFVYHTEASDNISLARFKIMERRLYYGIIWPSALFTTTFGLSLMMGQVDYYKHAHWMHAKLGLVFLLWMYHLSCGHFVKQLTNNLNTRSPRFFRIFNEIPTLLLVGIVMLVVVKP